MLRYMTVAAAIGLAGGVASPAAAQTDPVAVGQGAVLSTTMRNHSNRTAARRGTRHRTRIASSSFAFLTSVHAASQTLFPNACVMRVDDRAPV